MRHIILSAPLLCLALAGCGGKSGSGSSGATGASGPMPTTMLQSIAPSFSSNDHSCPQPSPSGSAAQVACHKAAQASCPEGMAPNRVDFSEENGLFLVRGYSCV